MAQLAVGLGRWLTAVGWCCLVALALTAVQLLPTLEAAGQTTRSATGMPSETLDVLRFNLFGLVGPAPESLPFMGWENRTGLTVLWIATALIAPILARGRARLRLQTVICLGLIVFGLGGALLFQSLPGFRLFRHPGGCSSSRQSPSPCSWEQQPRRCSSYFSLNPGCDERWAAV